MIYSLADYILTVSGIPVEFGFESLQLGGEGSYTESITLSTPNDTFTTKGDASGSWVHDKSLNRTGTAVISINQLSDKVQQLKTIFNIYLKHHISDGLTLTITDSEQNTVATAIDCLIQNVPDQVLGETSATQSWTFTCGQISYQ